MSTNYKVEHHDVVVPVVRALRETVYGVKTHYVAAGEGEPVLLIHGGGPGAAGSTSWENLMQALAPHFRVYAIDLMGFGASDKPIVDYSLQTFVEHVAGFVDALGLNNIRIMGNSQGAFVAIKYVVDNPGRVKSAAMISTGNVATACGLETGEQTKKRTDKFTKYFDGSKESIRTFMGMIVNDPSRITDELIEIRHQVASQPGHMHMMNSLMEWRKLCAQDSTFLQQRLLRQQLINLNIPTAILWGEDDRTAPLDPLGLAMRELLPQMAFHIVKGAGHQVMNDKPEETNAILIDHFRKH
ncbi:alpha/beta fold hydrolase [Novosphingobium sp. KN65.2]|uniref:alpha/beta fold hydrolase n=1 Tax=Novosphingobium sp. KN65.2 TaxID=1478134 RepID=UPI0005DBB3A2|nr:alpha/beta hydrolase [Novosphingobium sp. KN65.2]CDO38651.1 putative Meta cleavage compound hydrolase [Novosphingobium sp. KN65.2]